MKRFEIPAAIFLAAALFCFAACGGETKDPKTLDMTGEPEYTELNTGASTSPTTGLSERTDVLTTDDWLYAFEGTAAGCRYAVNSTLDGSHVVVTIWDGAGNRLFRQLYYGWREAIVTEETEHILSVSRGVGTGVWYAWYFDYRTGFISQEFECPWTVKAPYVVKVSMPDENGIQHLHLFNVFDLTGYSYAIELDFSGTANPSDALRKVEYLDNTHIAVTYLSGPNFEDKRTEFEVPYMDFETYMPGIYMQN